MKKSKTTETFCIEWLDETVKITYWTDNEENAFVYFEQLKYKSIKPEKFYKETIVTHEDGTVNKSQIFL